MSNQTIFTIGYDKATQPALIAALQEAGIELLADVRYLPLSRRPGFSKNSLKAAVEEVGIEYLHFRDVGTPPKGRAAARRGDKEGLRRSYMGQLELPQALAAAAQLHALAEDKRTCLLCFCRDADTCHRSLLLEELFSDFERIDLTPVIA